MTNRKTFLFAFTLALLLNGCATSTKVDQMTASRSAIETSTRIPEKLQGSIRVASVLGGEETNPLWTSEVGNLEFRLALEDSLKAAGLLSLLRTAGNYELSATLIEVKQPLFGFSMTVTARAHYRLIDTGTKRTILDEEIASSHTADTGDALYGPTRLRIATEGAARNNISQLIERIASLNLQEDQ